MYPRDRSNGTEGSGSGSFGDGFLGAMDDEVVGVQEEEAALPLIEEDILDPGRYQEFELEEASLDEPLPGLERILEPREEKWDYATADAHGSYEAAAKRLRSEDQTLGDTPSPSAAFENSSFDDGEVYIPDPEESLMGMLGDATGGLAEAEEVDDPALAESVDTDSAFDEVEDQDSADDDLESFFSSLGGAKDSDLADEEEVEEDSRERLQTNFRISDEDLELMQGFEVDEIISLAIDMGASDIHVPPGKRIRYRINGSMTVVNRFEPIPGEVTRRIQQRIVTNVADAIFLENWELDTSYTVRTGKHRGRRVRVSVTKGFEEVVLVMRIISDSIPLPAELEIEDELLAWSELPNGLVLMNGPTGTGKSTTLASIVQNIQMNLDGVIITVEKPVEYVYRDQGSALVYQREVGRDTLSFMAAMDSAMRMDPDVILIGEMRNAVEANAVIYAADTGHLSLSTTHANSAASTVSRIKKMFEGDEKRQAMESLASVSRGFASQVLCKTTDGKSRFAVREILTVDENIADLVVQGNDRAIRKVQEDRGITLDHGLIRAVRSGRCTVREARSKSSSPEYFDMLLSEEPKIF